MTALDKRRGGLLVGRPARTLQHLLRMTTLSFGEQARRLAAVPGFEPFAEFVRTSWDALNSGPLDHALLGVTFSAWILTQAPPREDEALVDYLLELAPDLDSAVQGYYRALRDVRRVLARVHRVRNGIAGIEEVATGERFLVQGIDDYPLAVGQVVLATIIQPVAGCPGCILGRAWRIAPEFHAAWLAETCARSRPEGFMSGRERYRRWIERGCDPLYWLRFQAAHGVRTEGPMWLAGLDAAPPPDPTSMRS